MSDISLNLFIYDDEIEELGFHISELMSHATDCNLTDKQVGDEVITLLHSLYNDNSVEDDGK